MLADAHQARDEGRYSDARAIFEAYLSFYPFDSRIHDTRFWVGWCHFYEGNYNETVNWEYEMLYAAPEDSYYLGYALYYYASAQENLGNCGYAYRAYEPVVYGEYTIDEAWRTAAYDRMNALYNDDGTICANWD